MIELERIIRTLPPGWHFEYFSAEYGHNRIAILSKQTLAECLTRGFRSALGQMLLLENMKTPVAIFRGIKRLRYFDGEADWLSGDKILIVVMNPDHTRVWDQSRFINTQPPSQSVFMAYLYEHEPFEIRRRWQLLLDLPICPGAKICGYEWAKAGDDGLPENWMERFGSRLK